MNVDALGVRAAVGGSSGGRGHGSAGRADAMGHARGLHPTSSSLVPGSEVSLAHLTRPRSYPPDQPAIRRGSGTSKLARKLRTSGVSSRVATKKLAAGVSAPGVTVTMPTGVSEPSRK
jgi:hypothetical protein